MTAIQRVLYNDGLYKSEIGGIFGEKTKEALSEYKNNINFDSIVNIFK